MSGTATAVGAQIRPGTPAGSPELATRALAELREDFDELRFLCAGANNTLAAAGAELDATHAGVHAATRELLATQMRASRRRYSRAEERLLALDELAARGEASRLQELAAEKASLADLIRAEQAITAALAAAADWQSPSFLHSTVAAAGRHGGRIRAHWNDYKRDRHLDAEAYERLYVATMVDGRRGLRALLTSCGMAAFTTVLSFLLMEGKLTRPVVVGAGLYHETRLVLERALPGRVYPIDEADREAFTRSVRDLRPSAVFLDSLSNTRWIPVPDLRHVAEQLQGTDTYLVVDNTGLSASCQPFAIACDSVRVIVFESLLKYAQLGLDRANAGLIVAPDDDAEALSRYREHLGTNVPDFAVLALPRPERGVLERRLSRLQRNALILAERLHDGVGTHVDVIYPGLPKHPCADTARRLRFRGGCLSVVFAGDDAELRRERRLVEAAVAEAARRGVALLGGSSFGFDVTRIYLTAVRAEHGPPFVRIAAGTEHRLEVERLADVLVAAVREVAS